MSAITVNAFPPLHSSQLFAQLVHGADRAGAPGIFLGAHARRHFPSIEPATRDRRLPDNEAVVDPPPPRPPRAVGLRLRVRRSAPDAAAGRLSRGSVRAGADCRSAPRTAHDAEGSGRRSRRSSSSRRADVRFPFTRARVPHRGHPHGTRRHGVLSIEILPNGRVGTVRIDQSSGFLRLDASAAREARKWRMKPGTQDGIAIPMWKRVPVTFQLKN